MERLKLKSSLLEFSVWEPRCLRVSKICSLDAEETLLRSELEAMCDCNPLTARHWIVRNTRTGNRSGQLIGYKLVLGSNCLPLAGSEAKFLRRAAFLKHNLWATAYSRDESQVFPGGDFLIKIHELAKD